MGATMVLAPPTGGTRSQHRADRRRDPPVVDTVRTWRGRLAEGGLPAQADRYRLGRDRGSPNDGSTLFSKRIMEQIRSPVRVRTNRPLPWRIPVEARR
jgi:hypothetical protein